MLVGILYSGPENRTRLFLLVKGVLYVSLKGLLKSSSSISLPFTMRSSLGSGSSVSKFSRIGLALFRLLCSLIIDFMGIVSFRFVLSLEGEFLLGRLDPPDLRLLWD
ncbi:hypothetical protein Tco_0698626 [Tanacetum coccineum]